MWKHVKTLESITPHISHFWRKTPILRTKDTSSNRGNTGKSFTWKPITKKVQNLHRCKIWNPHGFGFFAWRKMQFLFKDNTKCQWVHGRRKIRWKVKTNKWKSTKYKQTYLNLKESGRADRGFFKIGKTRSTKDECREMWMSHPHVILEEPVGETRGCQTTFNDVLNIHRGCHQPVQFAAETR